jgi:magnesium transporter
VAARDDAVSGRAAAALPPVIHTAGSGRVRSGSGVPCSFFLAPDGAFSRDLSPDELARVVESGEGHLWVDIDTSVREQQALLSDLFGLHPLAAEDALNPNSRVKVEEYPNGLFAIVRGVEFCDDTDDPYDVETYNLSFFLTQHLLVTAHATASPAVSGMRERVGRSHQLLGRGPVFLMHQMMDASVDAYFPVIDQIDAFIDAIEERVFVAFDQGAMRDIYQARRLVLTLRRQLAPQRELFNALANRPLALVPADAQRYFRDVYDHVMRIYDSLDVQRDLLGGTLDSYLTQVNNRTGEASKALAVVGAISIPFVVISGMWGMNFQHIPLSTYPHGFAIMMAIQLAIGLGLLVLLRRRGLL